MSRENYVRDVVHERLLVGTAQRHGMWNLLAERFAKQLRTQLRRRRWDVIVQGYPDVTSFALLDDCDAEGNSWYLKIISPEKRAVWLLWFGYNSKPLRDIVRRKSGYPSVFFSRRVDDPTSVHPYKTDFMGGDASAPNELLMLPLEARPMLIRWDHETKEMDMAEAVAEVARALSGSERSQL